MVPFPGRPGEGVLSQPWAGPTSLTPRHIAKWVRDVTSRYPAPVTVTETLAGERQCGSGEDPGPRVPAPAAPSAQPAHHRRGLVSAWPWELYSADFCAPKAAPAVTPSISDRVTSHSKSRPCN